MEYAFFALLVIAVTETIASAMWAKPYFRFGLPVLRMRVEIRELPSRAVERLAALHEGGIASPLVFRQLSPTEIAFRERAFGFRLFSYTPVLRGLIHVSESEGCVVVTGWLNWFVLGFLAFVAVVSREGLGWFFPVVLTALLCGIYLIQCIRYGNVVKNLRGVAGQPN